MKQCTENPCVYLANDGYTIIRIADGFDMGDVLWLGKSDTIDNYKEMEVFVDQYAKFDIKSWE